MSYKVTEESGISIVHLDGEIDMDVTEKAKEVIKFELDLRYEAAAASELSENTNMDESFYAVSYTHLRAHETDS